MATPDSLQWAVEASHLSTFFIPAIALSTCSFNAAISFPIVSMISMRYTTFRCVSLFHRFWLTRESSTDLKQITMWIMSFLISVYTYCTRTSNLERHISKQNRRWFLGDGLRYSLCHTLDHCRCRVCGVPRARRLNILVLMLNWAFNFEGVLPMGILFITAFIHRGITAFIVRLYIHRAGSWI